MSAPAVELAAYIRNHVDFAELVEFAVRTARGDEPGVTIDNRLTAAEWLADRAFGRPLQRIELGGDDAEGDDLESLIRRAWTAN